MGARSPVRSSQRGRHVGAYPALCRVTNRLGFAQVKLVALPGQQKEDS